MTSECLKEEEEELHQKKRRKGKEVHNDDEHCGALPVDCPFQDCVVGD